MAEFGFRVQRRSRCLLIVVIAAVGATASVLARQCDQTPRELPCTSCPPSSLTAGTVCEAAPGGANALPVDAFDVPHNGLALDAIDASHDVPSAALPNRTLLLELARHALTRTMLTAEAGLWRPLLAQPHAADLVQYIASCALDPGQSIDIPAQWGELEGLRSRLSCGFLGQLGLCGQTYKASPAGQAQPNEPTWDAEPPTKDCLERVSACVLARVNAVGARVPISIRGEATRPLPRVAVQTQFRENHGTPIQSFQRCDRACVWGDRVRRNCDWEPRFVGQCVRDRRAGGTSEPARKVELRVASGTRLRVRICKGIYGCDDTAPGPGAGPATPPAFAQGRMVAFPTFYGGQVIDQVAAAPGATVAFDCPDNGPLVKDGADGMLRTGYYSVMLGSLTPGVPLPAGADVALIRSGRTAPFATYDTYPAPEAQVFTYRAGASYGSLFSQPAPWEPLPHDKFACASELWNYQVALTEDRLCAGPTAGVLPGGCFGHEPPGQCDVPSGPGSCATAAPATAATTPTATVEPTIYSECRGAASDAAQPDTTLWTHPYTTYLNHPCDFFATDEECARYVQDRKQLAIRKPVRPDAVDRAAGVTAPPR